MGRVLVITNDFPPRRGGIESFVFSLCEGIPVDQLVVYTARMNGSARVDASVGYPVIRDRSRMLLPTPRVAREVQRVARQHDCDRVLFGAAAPLGLLASSLRRAAECGDASPMKRMIGLTHGHEVWWSRVFGAKAALRRIGDDVDTLTYVSQFCRREIARALSPAAAARMQRLSPSVDTERFTPRLDGSQTRRRWDIASGRPVILAASRLVARKGQDVLIEAMPRILTRFPDALLLVVGKGPSERHLKSQVTARGLERSVRFMPSMAWEDMPEVYAAADVFALPCRTRLRGLEPEALGIVFLEAAASSLPVVVGDSGGAPETVADGDTGYVVDPRDPAQVAERITSLLGDAAGARQMGERGRKRVAEGFARERAWLRLGGLLDLPEGGGAATDNGRAR